MSVEIEKDGHVWTVIHNRPEARNAVDPQAAEDLVAAFLEFDRSDARVAVFTGADGTFCAGWDLKYAASLAEKGLEEMRALDIPMGSAPAPRGALGPSRLELSKPVIGAIEGAAVAGGMELALWCDIRVMADRRSIIETRGMSIREGLQYEWAHGMRAIEQEGIAGAGRFSDGVGRHGDFSDI